MMNLELGEAIGIGIQTLVGVDTSEYPTRDGNCFSVMVKDHPDNGIDEADNRLDIGETRIVNFGVENLRRLLEVGVLEWPIQIAFLDESKRTGIIHDERIPGEWYDKHYCETCCPDYLLPLPQQAANDIDERAGHRTTTGSLIKFSHGDKSKEAARVRALANGEEWDPDEYERKQVKILRQMGLTVEIANLDNDDPVVEEVSRRVSQAMARLLADWEDETVRNFFMGDESPNPTALTMEIFRDLTKEIPRPVRAGFLFPLTQETLDAERFGD